MTDPLPDETLRKAPRYATKAAKTAASRRWVGQLARWGYASIGLVYVLIGVLAVLGLAGVGAGQYAGTGGAVRTVLSQPFGRVLLGIIAVGLAVYVVWRFCQSVLDVEARGRSGIGLARRFGLALSGLSYAGLTAAVLERLITGAGKVEDPKSDWTAALMDHWAGAVLVGLVGVAVVVVGLVQFYKAYRAGFLKRMHTSVLHGAAQWIGPLGRFGLAARGVVFGLIGVFLVSAAIHTNAREAMGLSGALRTLNQQPYGRWLTGIAAAGLLCFGVFMLAKAGFRYIAPQDEDEEAPREE